MNSFDVRKNLGKYLALTMRISDEIKFALYAIDKQDPVKPEYILHNNDIKKVGYFICSKCGRKLTKRPLPNFCPNCGQALDWRDDECQDQRQ